MAKHDRRTSRRQPPTSRSVSIQVPLPVLGVLTGVRQAFHGLCIRTGMQVLQAMMEADREALCGPKGRHQAARTAWRGGSVGSQVTLGGRQVALPRLRVRDTAGEVPLASFQWAAATDPLEAHTLEAVAAGVTTRQYARTLDPVPADVSERATSRSAVSRRFVALSAERLQAFVSRPLGELGLRVVCIDGKVFRDHCIVVALGIDAQGRKHVLGLREGATETAAVATGLLNDLVTRGLPTDRTMLFVIDGAPALRRAISDLYGALGIVQRCQFHYADVRTMPRSAQTPPLPAASAPRPSAQSEAFEKGQEPVRGAIAAGADGRRVWFSQGAFLQGEVGMDIDVGRVDAFVSEPQRDDGGVDPGVQQSHGGGMAQRVRGDVLLLKRGTGGRGGGYVCREPLGERVSTERTAGPRGKDWGVGCAGTLDQPRPQSRDHRLGKGRDPLLAALPETVDVRPLPQVQIRTAESDQFGGPQAGLDRECEEGVVATTGPSGPAGSCEQSVDFDVGKKSHQATRAPLGRNCEDTGNDSGVIGMLERGVAEQGMNGR